jgi:hypothetical protein
VIILLVSFSGILSLQFPGMIMFRCGELSSGSGGILGFFVGSFFSRLLNNFGAGLLLYAILLYLS